MKMAKGLATNDDTSNDGEAEVPIVRQCDAREDRHGHVTLVAIKFLSTPPMTSVSRNSGTWDFRALLD